MSQRRTSESLPWVTQGYQTQIIQSETGEVIAYVNAPGLSLTVPDPLAPDQLDFPVPPVAEVEAPAAEQPSLPAAPRATAVKPVASNKRQRPKRK